MATRTDRRMTPNLALLWILVSLLVGPGVLGPGLAAGFEADPIPSSSPALDLRTVKSDVYIVLMAADPVVRYSGDLPGLKATKPGKGQKVNLRSAHVRKYIQHLLSQHDAALKAVKAAPGSKLYDYTVALSGFAARLTAAQAKQIAGQPGVAMVRPDQVRFKTTDSSPVFLGLTVLGGPWDKGYDGAGVVVGVIDTGIWPEHPSFADDGSFPAPPTGPLPCEFGNTAHNPADAPFTCNNKLIGARQMLATYRALVGAAPDEYDSARDDDGHGTHTTSTAAGNSGVEASIYGIPRGALSGMAPRAHVIAYKALGNLGGFTSDLAAAIDQAVADGVDVINYSIGGGPSLTGADDIAFLFAADAGVFVATSAGNSGPGPGTIGGPASVPWITSVGASTQRRFFEGSAVSSDGWEYPGASITGSADEYPLVDAADVGGDLCVPGTLNPVMVTGTIVLCRRGVIGRMEKSRAVLLAGGVGMILYENSDAGDLLTDTHWVPTVHVDQTPGLAIKAYIATDPDPTARINGGFAAERSYAPSMTTFSSRGPNPVAPDIIKPDVTAPGAQILAGYSPTPDPGDYPGQLFAAIAGTSMSSPHVAGVFALLKQAHPDWTPAMAKSALMTTASGDVRDNDRVSPAGPFAMGAGHINPGGKWNKGSIVQPGLVYDAGFLEYLGFLCEAAPDVFANPAAACASLESEGVPTTARNLNLASIGIAELPGQQTVRRTVTSVAQENGWRTYTVAVSAPPGYEVTVSPSTLRLKRGQSATYEVTITNVGAPIGQWRFGSLTWGDATGHYEVHSPIAVRATAFLAPAELTGTGESGSLSFHVRFGYTGAYSAAAHGLVPATVTSDTVPQDPDQTFNRLDGFSKLHQFNLSGAAHFRIALPPDATEAGADLDIYVFNPSGSLAGSSTKGGTNELVDIALPMDGTWGVYVHGWSTPGGDSGYHLSTWAIPLAPGGSLSVDTAPAAATSGTIGTVGVSWTGATAGFWHLGAVSHTGDSGLMGLTLIEVDNR